LQVLEHLVKSVRDGLREAGVDDDQILYEVTGNLSFALCAIIDGSRQMMLDDQPVVPFLTFASERNGTDLIAAEGGSWMHEYVFGTVDEVFAEDDED